MASIRRGGGVQIKSTPVTQTPRSGLSNVLGFANSLASFGNAVKRLAERRNNERYAAEAARATAFIDTLGDQAEALRLTADDYTSYTKAVQPLNTKVEDWLEKNATDERTKELVRSRWTTLKDRQQQPLLAQQSERMAEDRARKALDVAAEFMPAPEEVGRNRLSPDANVRRAAAQELVAFRRTMTDPDGPILQEGGPDAAAQAYLARMKLVDKGTFHAWMDGQADKDVPNAMKTWFTSGAPLGDGTFSGATLTGAERRTWMNEWLKATEVADRARTRAEKAMGEQLEREADAWKLATLKAIKDGQALGADHADSAPGGEAGMAAQTWYLENMNTMYSEKSPVQMQNASVSEARISGVIALNGASVPGSLGVLMAEKERLVAQGGLHVDDLADQVVMLDEAIGKARDFSGLTPRQQREETARDRYNAFKAMLPADKIEGLSVEEGVSLLTAEGQRRQDVDGWLADMVGDPDVDPRVAADIAIESLRYPLSGGIRGGLLAAFRTPEALKALKDDPLGTLGAFPSIRTDLIVYADGRIDMTQTTANIRTETNWATDDSARNTEAAITFIAGALNLELYRDAGRELKALQAEADLDVMGRPMQATLPPGTADFGPGA